MADVTIHPWVPHGADILIIGQCPGVDEAKQGRPFVGRDGTALRRWLEQVGIDPEGVAYDNVHREFHGDPVYKPTVKERKAGWALNQQLISELQPKVVVLMGGPAAGMVFNGGITKTQGQRQVLDGIVYLACFHPGYYRNAHKQSRRAAVEAENDILSVLTVAARIARGAEEAMPVLPEGRYIMREIMLAGFEAVDVETYGDNQKIAGDPRKAEFVLAATAPRNLIMLDRPAVGSNARLLVHNVPYDGVALRHWDCRWEDTKMLAHMMGEADTTLKGLALRYLDRPMLTYPEAVRLDVLPEYCLSDAQATWDLYPILREITDPSILRLYDDLEAPLFALWTKMSIEGSFYLDHKALNEYAVELRAKVAGLRAQVENLLPRGRGVKRCRVCDLRVWQKKTGQKCLNGVNHKWEEVWLEDEPVNLNSPRQLLDALRTVGVPIDNTRADTLMEIAEDDEDNWQAEQEFVEEVETYVGQYPVVRVLLDYRKAHKELSTYIEPWLLIPEGTRIGCLWNPHGTWTMRVSSRGPNMQNIPGHLWRFFHAGPGYSLVSFDHSQLELRIAAHVSQDPVMLDAFRSGGDMHSRTMERLRLTDRRLAKIFNFGSLYDTHGTGAGFEMNARKYGVKLTQQEIWAAQREMRQLIAVYFKWQQEAMHMRSIPGLFGMIHRVPEGGKLSHQENEAVNAPMQGGGGLVTKYGMLALHRAGYEVVCQIHDSITVRVQDADVEEAKRDVPRIMEQAIPEPLSVPLLAEVK